MDYKMINPNGSPFSLQEIKDAKSAEQAEAQSQAVSDKLVNMVLSLFQ